MESSTSTSKFSEFLDSAHMAASRIAASVIEGGFHFLELVLDYILGLPAHGGDQDVLEEDEDLPSMPFDTDSAEAERHGR